MSLSHVNDSLGKGTTRNMQMRDVGEASGKEYGWQHSGACGGNNVVQDEDGYTHTKNRRLLGKWDDDGFGHTTREDVTNQ